ncbi:MAG: M28 family peptidase [Steroidobacteraceae bacterium]
MMIRRLLALGVPAMLSACAAAPQAGLWGPPGAPPAIDAASWESHVATLASDDFEGRKPGTRGERQTLEYLQAQFQRLGLLPGNGGSYLQAVPFVEITAGSDAALRLGDAALAIGPDAVLWTKRVQPEVSVADSPVVFVGHGVVAPEYGWNDYAGIDMRGKTALILINDPGWDGDDATLFNGRAMTYYGRWTYKFEEAARQGAAAALIIHETAPAAYGWDTVVNSWSGPQLDMVTPDGNAGRIPLEGWVTRDVARRLLAGRGLDLEDLKRRAAQRGFRPLELGVTAAGSVRNAIRRGESANVIGMIPGASRPGEYVLYMGHWDHLGRTLARTGDSIFNGAVDNATGTAGLIEIAAAFKRGRRPERSIVFLALTLEESGLLGSAYYTANPVFPLSQTVAALNMDALFYGGPTRDVSVSGFGASELERYLAEAAQRQGRVLVGEATPEKGFFYRSDHFNFAKAGVPSLYFKAGNDDIERGRDFARQQRAEFEAERYHKQADEYRPGMDWRGALQDVELMYAVGAKLANERGFPNWNPGNEFRATRDRSRAVMPASSP